MSKHTEFDAAIIAAIKAGRNTLIRLDGCPLLWEMARTIAAETNFETYRVFDRRLQVLRKAGKISFAGGVWVAV